MFEKETEERARKLEESQTLGVYDNDEDYEYDRGWNKGEVVGYEEGFQDGAEFGYNKANEWHYPAKGEFPKKSGNYILAFYGAKDSVANGKPCCEEIYFDAELLRWKERDTYDDLPYLEKKGVVIAWRELPEPPKES
jgi:hypothetical protein